MRHSKQLKSYASLYLSREDLFSTAGGSRVDVSPSTTHLSSQKVGFGRYRHDEGFQSSHHHHTALTIPLLFTRYYQVGSSGGYLFSVSAG